MIIERKKENVCQFQDVKEGEVFKYSGEYFMKVDHETVAEKYDDVKYEVNAIALCDGTFYWMTPYEEVELLVCKLVIE